MAVGMSIALAFVLLIGTYVWQQFEASRNVTDYESEQDRKYEQK